MWYPGSQKRDRGRCMIVVSNSVTRHVKAQGGLELPQSFHFSGMGEEAVDRDFILKSNHEMKLRELLGSSRIRELISQQPQIYFAVKDDEGFFRSSFPEGVDELYFQVSGIVKDIERLKLLYELFAE